jgi:hypothetical protein
MVIIKMENEDEESERVGKIGWMVKYYIELHYEENGA